MAPRRPQFVVQQHQATTLHYDFRLEVDGVLRSWAVPKGPSADPAQRRLAVEVDDHSKGWGKFEGRIRAGYGKGAVIVWDRGTFESLEEGSFAQALDAGHAKFRLDGEALVGRIERRTLRHRPGAQHPVDLQPEVVVQRRGLVLLDDELRATRSHRRRHTPPARCGSPPGWTSWPSWRPR